MAPEAQHSFRIHIVEDELVIAADLEGNLVRLGFEVTGISSHFDEAVRTIAQERPDLVLMDIQLHGRPAGIDIAEIIRQSWNIPVIFLTAYTDQELMQRARSAGAYGFLSKPFRVEDLNAAIRIALEQHRLGKEVFAEHNWLVTMLGSLSDGVIAADASGCVRYMNPAAEVMTQWTSAEALGRAIEEVYPLRHADDTDVPQCQLRKALSTRRPVAKQRFLMKIKDGGQLPVEDSAAPIILEGHLLGAVTIFLDISARLEVEAAQRHEQGMLQQQVQITNAALGQTKEELRALSGRLITAQEDERRRVARDLHDDLGQRAALMAWRVAELEKMSALLPTQAHQQVALLQTDLQYLTNGLREVSHQLHPASIADLGLPIALRALVEQAREQGFDITLISHDASPEIPSDVAITLYRIAQEALRNAVQHGENAPIVMKLSTVGDVIELTVEDPGPGFDLEEVRRRGGLGLLSMQERAWLLGGTLEIQTKPDQGTLIKVHFPLKVAAGR